MARPSASRKVDKGGGGRDGTGSRKVVGGSFGGGGTDGDGCKELASFVLYFMREWLGYIPKAPALLVGSKTIHSEQPNITEMKTYANQTALLEKLLPMTNAAINGLLKRFS